MVSPCLSYASMIVIFTANCLKLVYAVNVRQVAVNMYNHCVQYKPLTLNILHTYCM